MSEIKWKKRSEETQTLRAGCSKAEPKIFAPPQTPFSGARDGQILISWRWSLPLPTNPVWWGSMHAISSYRGNRPTNTQTNTQIHKPGHRQDRLQYTVPQLASAQCNYNSISAKKTTNIQRKILRYGKTDSGQCYECTVLEMFSGILQSLSLLTQVINGFVYIPLLKAMANTSINCAFC